MTQQIAVSVALFASLAAAAEATPILASQVASQSGYSNSQTNAVDPTTTTLSSIPNLLRTTVADFAVDSFTSVHDAGNIYAYALWEDTFTITGSTTGASVDFMATFDVTGGLTMPDDRALANDPNRVGYQGGRISGWVTGLPGASDPCYDALGGGGAQPLSCNVASRPADASSRRQIEQVF
jgi:hypothetical protein